MLEDEPQAEMRNVEGLSDQLGTLGHPIDNTTPVPRVDWYRRPRDAGDKLKRDPDTTQPPGLLASDGQRPCSESEQLEDGHP